MKRLLTIIIGLFLLISLNGQILRYSNYVAPPEEGTNDFLTNLVAYWAFEEESGTIDDSAGDNNSTGCDADYGSTGINGNCLSFTAASSDVVTFADADALRMYDQDFTYVAWINPVDYPAASQYYGIIGGENNSPSFSMYTTTAYLRVSATAISDGPLGALYATTSAWNMVATVFDSNVTTNNVTYYLNGATATGTFNVDFGSDRGTIYIGRQTGSSGYFNGLIDEVMIWKGRKLTTNELDDLYNGGTGLFFTDFD
jgi:hypothetical protein